MTTNKLIITFEGSNHAVNLTAENLQNVTLKLYQGERARVDAQIGALIPGHDASAYGQLCDEGWDLYLVGHGNSSGTRLHGWTGEEIARFLFRDCLIKKVRDIHIYACFGASTTQSATPSPSFLDAFCNGAKALGLRHTSVKSYAGKVHVNGLGITVQDGDIFRDTSVTVSGH